MSFCSPSKENGKRPNRRRLSGSLSYGKAALSKFVYCFGRRRKRELTVLKTRKEASIQMHQNLVAVKESSV
uniref:60S ribosomal protein L34 n=1 Tax=Syphacia muris TaxID=451379 RepID=A0A0N5B058_9BILA